MHWFPFFFFFFLSADVGLHKCDFHDAEEFRSNVRQRFNEVRSVDVESGHDKGGLRIDELFINFDKIL